MATPPVRSYGWPMVRSHVDGRGSGDPGLYGPDSEAWRLNRESMLLLGAGPARAAPADRPPLGRGRRQRPLRLPRRPVEAAAGHAVELPAHRLRDDAGGTGGDPAPEPRSTRRSSATGYHARDPELSMWVHATLVDSTIVAADAWLEPIDARAPRPFYDETKPIGRAFGIPESLLPADLDAFEAYLDAMLAARRRRPGGAAGARAGADDPAPATPRGPGHAPDPDRRLRLDDVARVGLLPPAVRDAYGFPWDTRHRLVSAGSWPAGGPGTRCCPTSFRQMPQARAADRRIAATRRPDPRVRPRSFTHPVAERAVERARRGPDRALDRRPVAGSPTPVGNGCIERPSRPLPAARHGPVRARTRSRRRFTSTRCTQPTI